MSWLFDLVKKEKQKESLTFEKVASHVGIGSTSPIEKLEVQALDQKDLTPEQKDIRDRVEKIEDALGIQEPKKEEEKELEEAKTFKQYINHDLNEVLKEVKSSLKIEVEAALTVEQWITIVMCMIDKGIAPKDVEELTLVLRRDMGLQDAVIGPLMQGLITNKAVATASLKRAMLERQDAKEGTRVENTDVNIDHPKKGVPVGTLGTIKKVDRVSYPFGTFYQHFIIEWDNGVTTDHANSHYLVSLAKEKTKKSSLTKEALHPEQIVDYDIVFSSREEMLHFMELLDAIDDPTDPKHVFKREPVYLRNSVHFKTPEKAKEAFQRVREYLQFREEEAREMEASLNKKSDDERYPLAADIFELAESADEQGLIQIAQLLGMNIESLPNIGQMIAAIDKALPDVDINTLYKAHQQLKELGLIAKLKTQADDVEFKVDSAASITGTSLQEYIEAHYRDLVNVLGEPNWGAGDKTVIEWSLSSKLGPVTLYDYKTNMTVQDFIDSPKPYEWHIGAHKKATAQAFKTWLQNKLGQQPSEASLKTQAQDPAPTEEKKQPEEIVEHPRKVEPMKIRPKDVDENDLKNAQEADAALRTIYDAYKELDSDITNSKMMATAAFEQVMKDRTVAEKEKRALEMINQIRNMLEAPEILRIGDTALALIKKSEEQPIYSESVLKRIKEMESEMKAKVKEYKDKAGAQMEKVIKTVERLVDFPIHKSELETQASFMSVVKNTWNSIKDFFNGFATLGNKMEKLLMSLSATAELKPISSQELHKQAGYYSAIAEVEINVAANDLQNAQAAINEATDAIGNINLTDMSMSVTKIHPTKRLKPGIDMPAELKPISGQELVAQEGKYDDYTNLLVNTTVVLAETIDMIRKIATMVESKNPADAGSWAVMADSLDEYLRKIHSKIQEAKRKWWGKEQLASLQVMAKEDKTLKFLIGIRDNILSLMEAISSGVQEVDDHTVEHVKEVLNWDMLNNMLAKLTGMMKSQVGQTADLKPIAAQELIAGKVKDPKSGMKGDMKVDPKDNEYVIVTWENGKTERMHGESQRAEKLHGTATLNPISATELN